MIKIITTKVKDRVTSIKIQGICEDFMRYLQTRSKKPWESIYIKFVNTSQFRSEIGLGYDTSKNILVLSDDPNIQYMYSEVSCGKEKFNAMVKNIELIYHYLNFLFIEYRVHYVKENSKFIYLMR